MPLALLVDAPISPAIWVPCQLLSETPQPLRVASLLFSVLLIQSPGSAGLLSRPSPSLAITDSEMKS